MSYPGARSGGYQPGGYYGMPEPSPELIDRQLDMSAADVVAYAVQQAETSGRAAMITPETLDAATANAESMLAVLGITPRAEQ